MDPSTYYSVHFSVIFMIHILAVLTYLTKLGLSHHLTMDEMVSQDVARHLVDCVPAAL